MPDDERLARAWRETSREEPAPALDDAIRAAARKAVGAGPRSRAGAPFGGRWRVPLSVAAVVVVSATITLLVAQREERDLSTLGEQAAPPASAPEPLARSQPSAPPDLEAREAPRAAEPAAAPPVSSDRYLASQPQAPAQLREREFVPDVRHEADETAPRAGATESDREAAAGRVASGAEEAPREGLVAAPVPSAEAPVPALRDQQQGVAAAPAAEPPVTGAMPQGRIAPLTEVAGGDGLAKRKAEAAAEMKQDAPAERHRAAPAAAARAPQPAAPQPGANTTIGPRGLETVAGRTDERSVELNPKAWLDRILELRRSGKLEEAEKSLKVFRARYPDYPLPDELKPPRAQPE
jgi:hypothetical protein